MHNSSVVAIAIAGLIALGIVAALIRILLSKQDPAWQKIRVGFFIERDRTKTPSREEMEKGFDED